MTGENLCNLERVHSGLQEIAQFKLQLFMKDHADSCTYTSVEMTTELWDGPNNLEYFK